MMEMDEFGLRFWRPCARRRRNLIGSFVTPFVLLNFTSAAIRRNLIGSFVTPFVLLNFTSAAIRQVSPIILGKFYNSLI